MRKEIKVTIGVDYKKNINLSIEEKIIISLASEIIAKHCDISKFNWIKFEFEYEKE